MGYVMIRDEEDAEQQLEHLLVKSLLFSISVTGVAALTGGGRTPHLARTRPDLFKLVMSKIGGLKAVMQWIFANPIPVAMGAAIVGSTVAQRNVWENIGDQYAGAVHYARSGSMSGSRGPTIPMDPRYHSSDSPLEGFGEYLYDLFF